MSNPILHLPHSFGLDEREPRVDKEHRMTSTAIEKRLAALEEELARLKGKVQGMETASMPWWERIAGTFENDQVYKQAMNLGRRYRNSLKPRASPRKKK